VHLANILKVVPLTVFTVQMDITSILHLFNANPVRLADIAK
jgi:hypothetical protein